LIHKNDHREVACAVLLDVSDQFLLQQRDNKPGIIYPGHVGLFGGHREGDETYLQCVVREIAEEISCFIPPSEFRYLTEYDGPDPEVFGGTVHAALFVVRGLTVRNLVVTEGKLLIVSRADLAAIAQKLTPTARIALKALDSTLNLMET
jgi:8-oxo-dGTP diphosphatase